MRTLHQTQITWRELLELYRIHDQPALNLRPRYAVAPTQEVPICRLADSGREVAQARGVWSPSS